MSGIGGLSDWHDAAEFIATGSARIQVCTAVMNHGYRLVEVETECVGCNLCALVCPVPNCITMVERRRAPKPDTWNERVATHRDQVPGGLRDLR